LYLLLLPDYPAFTIVAVSDAYLKATLTTRDTLIGRPLFDAFPENPNAANASVADNARESLLCVIKERQTHVMPVHKYDIQSKQGELEERYWSPSNSPVLTNDGELAYIIHRVEDVTELIQKRTPVDGLQPELIVRDQLLNEARNRLAEHERAEQMLAEKLRFTALSADIGVALTRLQQSSQMLQSCAQSLVDHLGAAFARIWILDKETKVLELKASAGLYTHLDGPHSRVPVGALKIGWIAQEKKPHLTNDVLNDPRIGDRDWARKEGMVAFAGYPLMVDGSVNGVMALFAKAPLKKDTLAVLGSVSDSIALGIERKLSEDSRVRQSLSLAQSHAEVARSEERFRAFVTASSDVVYRMNADWTQMHSLEGKALIPDTQNPTQSWTDLYIHPEDRDGVWAQIQRAIQTKSNFELEHRIISVDTISRWVFSRAIPILDDDGEIVEWLGAARDITGRKQAEQAFIRLTAHSESQRRLYETILSSTPDLVYVFDRDHRFTYANPALLTMWGKTAEEALGKNCLELGYEPWHAEMHDREIEQVIATKLPIRGDVPFTGTHGRRMYDYIFVPVFGLDGEVEAIAGTTRDVTERQIAEEEIRRANQDLEQFAYAATHDLLEPTRTVKLYAELLLRQHSTNLPDRGLEYLKFVQGGATRMEALIRDLLTYTQAGLPDPDAIKADAQACFLTALENLAAGISESRAQVTAGPLPTVQIGDTQLLQVFQNLIGNAIKYRRPDTAPVIHVSAQCKDRVWQFTVSDNGIGIEDRFKDQVFGLFKRLHNHTQYSGTGIGLALCKRIIERCNGQIWVESKPGQGSQFHFTLPGFSHAAESTRETETFTR
jgi:PAS domain S-box-containing protein